MTLQQQGLWGDEPVARRTDPQTSWDAARSIGRAKQEEQKRLVLAILRSIGPATDEQIAECAASWGKTDSPSGLRTRRIEMARETPPRVVYTGRRIAGRSGRDFMVWALP